MRNGQSLLTEETLKKSTLKNPFKIRFKSPKVIKKNVLEAEMA